MTRPTPMIHRASALDLAVSTAALVLCTGGGLSLAVCMAVGRLPLAAFTVVAAVAGMAIGISVLLVSLGERVIIDADGIERHRLWTLLWRRPLHEVEFINRGAPGSLGAAVLVINRRSRFEIDRLYRRNYAGRLRSLAEE